MSVEPGAARKPTIVSLADEDAVKGILVDTLFGLSTTVNNLSRLRPSKRERYRVTVFGSAFQRACAGGHQSQREKLMPEATNTNVAKIDTMTKVLVTVIADLLSIIAVGEMSNPALGTRRGLRPGK